MGVRKQFLIPFIEGAGLTAQLICAALKNQLQYPFLVERDIPRVATNKFTSQPIEQFWM